MKPVHNDCDSIPLQPTLTVLCIIGGFDLLYVFKEYKPALLNNIIVIGKISKEIFKKRVG